MSRSAVRRFQPITLAFTATLALVAGLAGPAQAAFPGQNGRIALEGDTQLGIFSIEPNGTGLKRLTPKSGFPMEPAFSADGKSIAFERDQKLWKMDADGSDPQKLGRYPGGGQISSCISWSPDGRKLAFDRDEDIWTIHANGKQAKRVTAGGLIDQCPSWSPNGKQIVFARNDSGQKDLILMHVDGSDQRVLATPQGGTAFGPSEPDWAPNGKRIAFINGTGNGDIATVRPDGTDYQLVVGTQEIEVDPAYSPDAKQIAYASLKNVNTTRIRRISADGSGSPADVSPAGAHWFNPSWQPR